MEAQTTAVEHLVFIDKERQGPQISRNQLVKEAKTEWLFPLDDDDILDPDCIETLLQFSSEADVVYPWCRMHGRSDTWVPNRLFNARTLARRPYIPVSALIRKDIWEIVGGQRPGEQLEDWFFYQRAYLHGARFKCIPEVLWTYRFHDSNQFQYER